MGARLDQLEAALANKEAAYDPSDLLPHESWCGGGGDLLLNGDRDEGQGMDYHNDEVERPAKRLEYYHCLPLSKKENSKEEDEEEQLGEWRPPKEKVKEKKEGRDWQAK